MQFFRIDQMTLSTSSSSFHDAIILILFIMLVEEIGNTFL
jgi:hypothetical protein